MTRTLEEILAKRDEYEYGTVEWNKLNGEKADLLESKKPSVSEQIIYFKEEDLNFLGSDAFIQANDEVYSKLKEVPMHVQKRSLLEYVAEQRHPIPYVYIRDGERIFFISRESGSGELRLVGKKGMLGGHVGDEDLIENDLQKTLTNGMLRELWEEAAIGEEDIASIDLKGLIKSDVGVDNDHLGLVYEITLKNNDIQTQEEGVINGLWLNKNEIRNHYDSFESWSKIVIDNVILK